MTFFRVKKRGVAMLLVATLLFAQGAIAAYVCDATAGALSAAFVVKDCPEMKDDGDDSAPERNYAAPGALCQAHCQSDAQHVELAKPLPIATFGNAVLTVRPPFAVSLPTASGSRAPLPHHSPPLAILNCCLRT